MPSNGICVNVTEPWNQSKLQCLFIGDSISLEKKTYLKQQLEAENIQVVHQHIAQSAYESLLGQIFT
jgi:hypothetical protein